MRPVALTMPTLTDNAGTSFKSVSSARPRASDHWPTRISLLGTATGTVRPLRSTLSSVSIRVWSVATTLATSRGLPGTLTKMSVGLLAKLKELEMT